MIPPPLHCRKSGTTLVIKPIAVIFNGKIAPCHSAKRVISRPRQRTMSSTGTVLIFYLTCSRKYRLLPIRHLATTSRNVTPFLSSKGLCMDFARKPLYTGPMFPLGSRTQQTRNAYRLRGTIVGIGAEHSGDTGTTRVLTVQLSTSHSQAHELLHSDVEIIIHPKS